MVNGLVAPKRKDPLADAGTPLSRRAREAGGQPIGELMHRALARPELISLAAGFVDQASLPVEATRVALEQVLAEATAGKAALQYGTTLGFPRLRELLLARMRAADPGLSAASLERVIVTAGSNQLLHLLADTLLDPGDIVLVAAPTYFVFLGALASVGARSLGVAADAQGLVPESLDERFAALARSSELSRVKAIYATSYFDNPSGASIERQRRPRIVDLVQRWSQQAKRTIYLIEDTAYRELRYEGQDLPSLRSLDATGEHVILTGSFSKSFSPGIRVGWGLLPPELVQPVCDQKQNIDFGSPNFNQHLMAAVLESGLFDPHVAELRGRYRQKLKAMLDAAERHLGKVPGASWQRPQGGLYVWLTLPPHVDAGLHGRLFQLALDAGVLYVPGEYCYPAEGPKAAKNTVRLSFGVQDEAGIARGMKALGEALAEVC
jgi:2-aminoadipate transaminase